MTHDILISLVQHNDRGAFFEVLRSDGGISQPNGTHIGGNSTKMCENTMSHYIKNGTQVAENMYEFNLIKDWYNKIMPGIIYTLCSGIEVDARTQVEDIKNNFPKKNNAG